MANKRLTDLTIASAITNDSLIHIVNTGDTTQYSGGSSYKTTLGDVLNLYTFTGNTSASCITDLYVTNIYGCSPITIHDSIQSVGSTASGLLSHAEGSSTQAIGDYSHAEGDGTISSGGSSHAEGIGVQAIGDTSHAEGFGTISLGYSSHSEGRSTQSIGNHSHAEGSDTQAIGDYSHSEGFLTITSGESSHAEGSETQAIGDRSHAEGAGSISSGYCSHAEGSYTTSIGDGSHAEGYITNASGSYSHAEGESTISSGYSSHAEGASTQAIGDYSHSEGNSNQSIGNYSHSEGDNTISSGESSHSEGNSSISSGKYSHAEGYSIASGDYSHSEGGLNEGKATYLGGTALGVSSHAEGSMTFAIGEYSHSEGKQTSATTAGSHSEGYQTVASGGNSHAEGFQSITSGIGSHAEGFQSVASGFSSHAEGFSTAIGEYSHSEGGYFIPGFPNIVYSGGTAVGYGSHAEGIGTISSGDSSHAEGENTISIGAASHTEGLGTISNGNHQHVSGMYNLTGDTTQGAFIVGNGTDDSNRSNLLFAGGNQVNISGTLSATTYENLPISGVTTTGTGESLIASIVDGNVILKSITGTTLGKISASTVSDTIELDVVEENLFLWDLVVQGNRLLDGGVTYISGLTFSVSPLQYIINGVIYSTSASTTVTLSSGDSTYDRIDVIYANDSLNVGVLQGTPSSNPEKPLVSGDSQVEVTFVIVPASATSISYNELVIFEENAGPPAEWTFSTNNPTKITTATTSFYSGTTSIQVSGVTGVTTLSRITFSSSTPQNISSYNNIEFALKNISANTNTNQIWLRFLNGGVQNGNYVKLRGVATTGFITYNPTNTSIWQLFSIPLWKFYLSTNVVDVFEVLFYNSTGTTNQSRYYFDTFKLIDTPSLSPNNVWGGVKGDGTTVITAPSPNATLTISGGTNIGSTAVTPTTIRIDLDNNVNLSGGITAATDSQFNGIRVGKGSGNISSNTVVGNSALTSNVSGNSNVAIGFVSLQSNLASVNTAVGVRALQINTTGSSNVGVGYGALNANTTGSSNTSIGTLSLNSNTFGGFNVGIGGNSLPANTTGSYNSSLGFDSGLNNTISSYNTYLGYSTSISAGTNYTGSTAIGYNAQIDANDSIILGDQDNVGIGVNSPTARLDISGTTGYNQLRLRTSISISGTTDPSGNVGDIAWDNTYFYWKTSGGWLRVSGSTW